MDANSRKENWKAFMSRVEARREQGARDYGDRSFSRDPVELCEEIRQELEDVCGWSSILWSRLLEIEKALKNQKQEE